MNTPKTHRHPCPKLDTQPHGGGTQMTDENNLPDLPEGWVWARNEMHDIKTESGEQPMNEVPGPWKGDIYE